MRSLAPRLRLPGRDGMCGLSGVREAGQGQAEPSIHHVCGCGHGLWPPVLFPAAIGKVQAAFKPPFPGEARRSRSLPSSLFGAGWGWHLWAGPSLLSSVSPSVGQRTVVALLRLTELCCLHRLAEGLAVNFRHPRGAVGVTQLHHPAARRRTSAPFREYLTGIIPHPGHAWLHPSNNYDVRAVCWAWQE